MSYLAAFNKRLSNSKLFMLTATKVAKRFGSRIVLRDLSFEVAVGQCVSVIGPNGGGKSTLLRLIAGLTIPSRGEVRFEGQNPKPFCALAAPDAPVYKELSCLENLQFFSRGASTERLQNHLTLWGLGNRGEDLAGDLSSGLRARLALCVADWFCENGAKILLLDEPSANLDESGRELVAGLIERQKKRGLILLATNDERDFIWCNGQISVVPTEKRS
jgi:heme exporter protein A